jgi:hypothetical protein
MRTSTPTSPFSLRKLVLIVACAAASGSVFAQWQWLDASGRKVYSDTAPPQGTLEKNILKRPSSKSAATLPASEPAASAPPAVAKPAGVDPKLEAKRKEAEALEAAKRKESDDKVTAARAENCNRAKSAKATLQMGTRVQTVNAKGERVFLDDAARVAEGKRLDGIIAIDCSPLPVAIKPAVN